ncbi:MAG: 3-deoxy-manno-octulosonate-8-phosphatase KdsC [Acidiferrobacterales bacterium]
MTGEQTLAFDVTRATLERAAAIKLVLFDVDGVLTDGRLFVDNKGEEYKAFNSRDGHGMKMLQRNGVEIGVITGRTSRIVEHRTKELGVSHVYQGCHDKLPVYEKLVAKLGLTPGQVAFAGDDVVDLPIMLRAGFAVAVQDAHFLVKKNAHWVTPSAGGQGAARDLCELIMAAQGTYASEMRRYF